ncbi:hypothetical protein GBF38_010630 [Nibea albiflora]|uniref:Uncharacterized protein n=1 Tax=Nibea albiflora TaxID=240163 RepID=A0ACB7ERY8_NIBAL|nr:hypothetical protein GBF38_010630 [Nibea albiflora]
MRVNIFSCLFVFVLGCNVTAEISHLRVLEEKNPFTVSCPLSVQGDVTWSRERNRHKVDLLTIHGDRDIRYNDPDRRFSSLADKSLHIRSVTDSDTGRYFCNDEAAVDLTVIPSGTDSFNVPERVTVELTCPHRVGGSGPSWSRDFGEIDERRVSRVNEMLTIRDVRPADAGLYYCDGRAAAYLTVSKEEASEPAVSYLWQTVRTVIGVLYLIIMTSITVTVTVWTKEITHLRVLEKNSVTVSCPLSVEGDVTWSRERNRHKVDLFTTDGDKDVRYNDPGKRFSSLGDKSLYIQRVINSDTGRYFCNDEAAVDLTVIPSGTDSFNVPERVTVELTCPHHVGGSGPSWSRDFGEIDERRVSRVNEMLTIRDVRPADAGLYYCDGRAAAYLTVSKEEASEPGTEEQCNVYDEIQDGLVIQPPNARPNLEDNTYSTICDIPLAEKRSGTHRPNESPYSVIDDAFIGGKHEASPVLRSALVVQAGQKASLACNLTSSQEITWYLLRSDQLLPLLTVQSSRVGEDTVNVHTTDSRISNVGALNSGLVGLEIEEVQEEDAGLYFCTGRCAGAVCVNRGIHLVIDGGDEKSARQPCWSTGICVLPAVFVLCVVTVIVFCLCSVIRFSVPEDHHVCLPCGGAHTSDVVWTHRDRRVPVTRNGDYETNDDPQHYSLLSDGSLRLLKLDDSDSGEYQCNQQLVAELQVLTGKDFTVSAGRTLLLPCSSSSKPRLRWFYRRDGGKRELIFTLFRNGTMKPEREGGGRLSYGNEALQIEDLQLEDAGQYQCSGQPWTRVIVTAALLMAAVVGLGLMIVLMVAVCILLTSVKCRRKKMKNIYESVAPQRPEDTELQPWKTCSGQTEREVYESPSVPEETLHYASLGRQNWRERPTRTPPDQNHHNVIYSSVITRAAAR